MAKPDIQTRPPTVLEDPGVASLARVYAVALLNAAKPEGAEPLLLEFKSFLDDVLAPQPKFERLLTSPLTAVDDKVAIIDRVLGSRGSPMFVNFLKVLARHGRFDLVRVVGYEIRREYETRSGRRRVKVRSAKPLSESALKSIEATLRPIISADPVLETSIDPGLVGGVVIQVGDTVYDGSVRNRLKQLRARLRERCMHEVQRGRDRFSHSEGN
jgi:F-type H+-transporting ATPase subunit delta